MTVKKLALLGVASMATLGMSISMAGGPATCDAAPEMSGVYVGVNAGGTYNNSMKFDVAGVSSTTPIVVLGHTITSISNARYSNAPWGWTADALIGYQFNNNWALQFGYIWNQEQKLSASMDTHRVSAAENVTLKMKSYNFYLALRGMLPLWDDLAAYMMVGPAWTHLQLKADYTTASADSTESNSYWSPMAAVGLSWHVADGFTVNLQYMYLMGDLATSKANSLRGQDRGTQRVTLGFGYLFAM